ncbi:Phytanoyl-CoA dioxygenase [Phytophthora cactorum]|nr:Phytanoyl-CoA dioxygenase [Phytophthora cactorum]
MKRSIVQGAEPIDKKQRVSNDAPPLDKQAIDSFIRDGFVLLRGAFSSSTAQKCRDLIWTRLAQDGITKDSSTWVERHGIPGTTQSVIAMQYTIATQYAERVANFLRFLPELYTVEDDPVWGDVVTPRLKRAMDQICGKDRWEDFGLGWWMITFPDQAEPPWGAAGKWHVDGASYQHHVDSKESGLLVIFLFSDIGPGEGGTALSVGSHKWIAGLLEKNEPRGMKGGAVSYQARQFQRREVAEVNGKAGDVMLVHPFLLHARSKNLGQKGAESVRIMCNPNVRLRQKMNLNLADDAYSPVEQAIVDALEESVSDSEHD